MPGLTVNNIGSAARKRSRRVDDDEDDNDNDEEEVLDVQERRKRARTSARASEGKQAAQTRAIRDASESSSGEDKDVEMEEQERDSEPAATQYEIMRDAGFKHLEHADEDDRRATQRLQRRASNRQSNRAGASNHAAENGILESIECINFMCHERLHCELGPLLNFIVGENGSGKSAILTAITLCLGGKASSTNRGGSLKNFIKEGRDKAILIVKIKNKGDDAYQRDMYGDSIIVERRFSRGGSSGFNVKSATGRVITTKKSEVDEIVEYYCLQVDNPLNVLSQDNARQFLNQASPKLKYKFFCQGVQLQQLDDDYRIIQEYLASNEHKEGDLEVKMETAQKEYDRAKRDHDLVMKYENMRQQCRLWAQKAVWAQVVEAEREVEQNEEKIREADGQIAEAQVLVEQTTQRLENIDGQLAQAEEAAKEAKEENDRLEAESEKVGQEQKKAKGDLAKLQIDERDAHSRLKDASQNVKEYEQKIREEEQRLQDLNGDAHSRKQQELEAAEAGFQRITKESQEATQRVLVLNNKVEAAETEIKTLDKLIEQKRGDETAVQKRVKELQQGQGSLYDAYESRIPQLLRMIENDQGFEHKPIGPIGAHIQVLQPAWSPMLERTFGEILNGFVVTSKRDQQRLNGMMKRLSISRSPIAIGNARPIDTSRSEPDVKFDTILRILKIENPLIRNQLIINNRIEKTILVKDQRDAERIMLDGTAPPRNVSACFHLHPGKGLGWAVRLTVTANGISSSPVRPDQNQKPRLKSDSLQETSLHTERLGQLQAELNDLQSQRQRQQRTIQGYRNEMAEANKTTDRNKQRLRAVEVKISDIQQELDSFEGVDGRLEGLREDKRKAEEDYNIFGGQYGQIKLRKQQQNERTEEIREKLIEAGQKVAEFKPQLKKAESKVTRLTDQRRIALQEKNQAFDNRQMCENEKARLEARRGRLEQRIGDFAEQASAQCERVHIGEDETYDGISKKFESLSKAQRERERKKGMSDQQIIERTHQTMEALTQLRRATNQVRKENKALKKYLNTRIEKWRNFQRFISSQSRANFMYLLSERDFRGKLILDHQGHTLEVQVEPDKTRKNAAARNTKTLSGGEKSFSSICLLLAIWEAMGSPLRCLDEFDVFMDNVNRAISTNMLISAARNSVGRQYILITPNAIEGRATLEKDVKIIRLTDPRQRRLADP